MLHDPGNLLDRSEIARRPVWWPQGDSLEHFSDAEEVSSVPLAANIRRAREKDAESGFGPPDVYRRYPPCTSVPGAVEAPVSVSPPSSLRPGPCGGWGHRRHVRGGGADGPRRAAQRQRCRLRYLRRLQRRLGGSSAAGHWHPG